MENKILKLSNSEIKDSIIGKIWITEINSNTYDWKECYPIIDSYNKNQIFGIYYIHKESILYINSVNEFVEAPSEDIDIAYNEKLNAYILI